MKLKSYILHQLAILLPFVLALATMCSTSAQNIFTQNGEKHIFEGEVRTNSQGLKNASGCHHHQAIESGKARYVKNSLVEGPNNIYRAKIEVFDMATQTWVAKKANRGYSTFFPKNWTKDECIAEIKLAYQNRYKVRGTQNEFRGFSKKGNFEIVMYLNDRDQIISAFPKDWEK